MIKETVRKQDQQEALRREQEVQQEVAELKQASMHDASSVFINLLPSLLSFSLCYYIHALTIPVLVLVVMM